MTPEGRVKEAVKRVLVAYSVYYHMPVQNGMGKPSVDFICCVEGLFLAIETKAGTGRLTKRQEATLAEMAKAGAETLVIRSVEDVESILRPTLIFIGAVQCQTKKSQSTAKPSTNS